MKHSIVTRVITLILAAVVLLAVGASCAEEAVMTSTWQMPTDADFSDEGDYEIVVIEQEAVPLAEGPVALQKLCVLHFVLFAVAVALFFVLRSRALRIEAGNRVLENRLGLR